MNFRLPRECVYYPRDENHDRIQRVYIPTLMQLCRLVKLTVKSERNRIFDSEIQVIDVRLLGDLKIAELDCSKLIERNPAFNGMDCLRKVP